MNHLRAPAQFKSLRTPLRAPQKRPLFQPFAVWIACLLGLLVGRPSYGQTRPVPAPNPAVICWQEGVKLRWRDFQAPSNPMVGMATSPPKAAACCGAEIAVLGYKDPQGRRTFLVESFFVKQRSWVRDSSHVFQRTALEHEQLHFDITELFARRIRLQIAQRLLVGANVWGPEMGQEIACLLQELDEFNVVFDQETHPDPSPPLLRRWQNVVCRDLAALDRYKSNAATCGQ